MRFLIIHGNGFVDKMSAGADFAATFWLFRVF
jgi:hypothetical protein